MRVSMKYRLFAADIDGTLLNSKSELTDRTVKAVKALIAKGYIFTLSTGRPLQGIATFVSALDISDMPFVLFNGALVMHRGEKLYSSDIEDDIAIRIIDEGHKRDSTMICWSDNRLYAETENEKSAFYKSVSRVEPIIIKDLKKVVENGQNITKIVWYDDPVSTPEYFFEMKELLGDKVSVYPSRKDFLEFVSVNCSKATALETIGKRLNISREEIIAAGDGYNDLPMLEYAGLSVAMGNAETAVKEKCDVVALSCDEDGLADFIEKNLL